MVLYTIGFTQKSAQQFFELIKSNSIEILVDIRLNNKSQLAGFTKGDDLRYFLDEICDCKYQHCVEYAPTIVVSIISLTDSNSLRSMPEAKAFLRGTSTGIAGGFPIQ